MTESQMNGGEKTTLAYKAIPINVEGMQKYRCSPLGQQW